MPRAFTREERADFRVLLRGAARDNITRYGLRRTRVADLASAAGLSKGAFYLFYDSKEELFLEVFALTEQQVRGGLLDLAKEAHDDRVLRDVLRYFFDAIDAHPMLGVLADPEEAKVLWRAMPVEDRESRREDEDRFYTAFFQRLIDDGLVEGISAEALAGLPRLVSAVHADRAAIGDDRFGPLVNLLVDGLAKGLAG